MGSVKRLQRFRHVIRRARERWDVWLEPIDVGMLNQIVRYGIARKIEKTRRKSRKVMVTTLSGAHLPVIFCEKKNTIVTVLPPQSKELQRFLSGRDGGAHLVKHR